MRHPKLTPTDIGVILAGAFWLLVVFVFTFVVVLGPQ